ncbi:MAG TPA: enoyl-CoA hydratase/isomerase family protein [Nocardioidaceae bacterium]|nr:enoyl-CoA hydratase/isomerase family protein [Nocardioidaceae bacterium]
MAENSGLVLAERHPLTGATGQDPTGAAAPPCAVLLRLNRPDSLNPLDSDTVHALAHRLAEADDDPAVRAVLVTGAGRAFSAGGDLVAYRTLQRDREGFPAFLADLHRTFDSIPLMRKPVVALVNGVTAAGGLELVLACDLAYAAGSARIGDAHVRYGQMGGGGALSRLPRAIGPRRARELVFSGRYLDADRACEWGLVNRVVPDEELLEAGLEFAREVAAASPLAVANAKLVMNTGWDEGTGLAQSLRVERERTSYYCVTSDDAPIGLEAFAAKQTPHYRGR